MRTTNNIRKIKSNAQTLINSIIFLSLGVTLFVYWVNNKRVIDHLDLLLIKGELVSYDYREWSPGRGSRPKCIFIKTKGYECEFISNASIHDFQNELEDKNFIEIYINKKNSKNLNSELKSIESFGLTINNTRIELIDKSLKEKNLMTLYGVLILGIGAFLYGIFEFARFVKLRGIKL